MATHRQRRLTLMMLLCLTSSQRHTTDRPPHFFGLQGFQGSSRQANERVSCTGSGMHSEKSGETRSFVDLTPLKAQKTKSPYKKRKPYLPLMSKQGLFCKGDTNS